MTTHMSRLAAAVRIFGAVSLISLLIPSLALGATAPRSALDLQVPVPPTPVNVGGDARLVYELCVTNYSADEVLLNRVIVRDADRRTAVADFAGAEVAKLIGYPGQRMQAAGQRVIEPGTVSILYFWIGIDKTVPVPHALTHEVRFEMVETAGRTPGTAEGGVASVRLVSPVVLSAPVRGGPWVAVYDPSMDRGHRRMLFAVDGRARIPARFAIDWFKVDPAGHLAHGDSSVTSNWYGYNEDVLAVADAVVLAVRDDVPESPSVRSRTRNALQDGSGNYITLDLGLAGYAFYEHLKPGSIKVKAGDHVISGEPIASLGFTGDSTGPHLHFHVADTGSLLAADGLPYVLAAFEVLGNYESIAAFGSGRPWTPATRRPDHRTIELPEANAVIQFGQ